MRKAVSIASPVAEGGEEGGGGGGGGGDGGGGGGKGYATPLPVSAAEGVYGCCEV